MAFPQFSKSGITTLVFAQGTVSPDVSEETPRQVVSEAEDGTLWVYTLSPAVTSLTLTFQDLPAADLALLEAWFRNALIDWAGNTFTYTDADSTAFTVRFLGPLRKTRSAVDTYDMTLPLRVEVS